ncbi:PucR family transcriptional regulator [Agromyces mediolanus]|uniref:PucR family transcriptional regulator n=1 Tax=Agromyces mediolanus TaxID=41986 RepID=A0A918FAE0_AGRME|nr:PucR family transcriptional regulator [Agromyces mediolanus]GGR21066.1 PucR family transcriptional regulator [Agromyces mediolanus]GLJ73751.1 PucR family transcriptional regulator [Agromyces mediolanus]
MSAPPTIRSLLEFGGDRLQLLVPGETADAIERPIAWVHGSDLPDPTPFLAAGHLLLTDGAQFPPRATPAERYEDYVVRLQRHGIVGLGFGARLHHGETPAALIAACRAHGLPLIEMTDLTPYLAYIQFVAEALDAQRTERIRWSVAAQRALTKAALRPDGLASIVAELERQLDCRVLLFDAAGSQLASDRSRPAAPGLRAAVADALGRGVRGASRLEVDGLEYALQTIGVEHLDGAIVLAGLRDRDPSATDLVNSVIAFASLALAQHRALAAARLHLRDGVLQQLLGGAVELAGRTARDAWGELPDPPLGVFVLDAAPETDLVLDALELAANANTGGLFFGRHDGRIVVLVEEAAEAAEATVRRLIAQHALRAGRTTATSLAGLPAALDDASVALRRARGGTAPHVAEYRDLAATGVLGALAAEGAGELARATLRTLREHDERTGGELWDAVEAWIEHDCAWEPAARRLGVHRHTLRHRIDAAGELLGLDPSGLRGRLELWAAVQLSRG